MDAIEILGSLLGGGSQGGSSRGGQSGGGLGGKILEELLKAGLGGGPQPEEPPARAPSRGGSVSHRPIDVQSEAGRLEDLLNVATGKKQNPASQQTQKPSYAPEQSVSPSRSGGGTQTKSPPQIQPGPLSTPSRQVSQQDEALALVRAMINASKADGQVDSKEQEAILSRVPNNQETIQFLRQEFAKPLDVREFTWNVPLGLEVQVYTMSLASINLDSQTEKQYLLDLAHGLRLDPELVNQIHTRYGAPAIF